MLTQIATSAAVPAGIVACCLFVGAAAASRFLPELPPGGLSGICLLLVCGLVGAGVALAGLDIFTTIEATRLRDPGGLALSDGLADILWHCGLIFGMAAIVFLLAARNDDRAGQEAASGVPHQPQA